MLEFLVIGLITIGFPYAIILAETSSVKTVLAQTTEPSSISFEPKIFEPT